ncbi:MAG: SRPBCC family protein [Gemmatimonadaceae bacterium]
MALATAGPRRVKSARSNGARGKAAALDNGDAAHNVAGPERVGSVALGAALITYGARRRGPAGVVAALVGGAFVHRGATGNCMVYRAMGVSTGSSEAVLVPDRPDVTSRAATVNARKAIKLERAVTIEVPRSVLYAFWRNFANLPRFMEHLLEVRVESAQRSHWIAKGPAGANVEWDAEIVNDVPDSLIAWKTVGHTDVPNAGSVHFSDAPGGRGTIVKVEVDYEPPAGRIGALVARLFGEDPDRQIREDLRKFKQLMETGEITTSARRRADSAYVGSTPQK